MDEVKPQHLDDSIDNGMNFMLNDAAFTGEPSAKGPDLAALSPIKMRAQDLFARAKDNPWLSIAAASAGALAMGFIVGRLFNNTDRYKYEEYPMGYDE